MHPPIRALVFDIGNVLCRFDFTLALRAVSQHSEVHDLTEILAAIDRVKLGYEDGQLDRPSFLRAAFDVLRYRGTEAQFITAWEEIFTPNEPMHTLIEQLHPRYPLYLLSNIGDIHRDYLFRTYPIFRHFTAGIYSFEVRASKPGPEIFHIAQRTLHLDPATTLFIDDLLPNIETARALGYHTHHYHHDRHALLLADFAAHGIL